jgi:hypothetical protein
MQACSFREKEVNAYRVPLRKPEGKRPLGRTKFRRRSNMKWILEKLSSVELIN